MDNISTLLDDFFSHSASSLNKTLKENRLERMRMLLSLFDNPEKNYKTIHVAGSKGKGSVCRICSEILEKNSIKCGLYLSPHVYDVRERFTLYGKFFPDSLYSETLHLIKKRLEGFSFPSSLGPEDPTTFELYTLFGYLIFSLSGVDVALIETGIGGRIDATNTIESVASCITKIELEHTSILGNTLFSIAREKSGIIRENTPTILLEQEEEVMNVVKEVCKEKNSPLYIVKDNKDLKLDFKDKTYSLSFNYHKDCDRVNALLSLSTLLHSSLLDESILSYTLQGVDLPSRYERYTYKGTSVIFDGAHTLLSVKETLKAFLKEFKEEESLLVFSCAGDKKESEMEELLFPHFKSVITTTLGEEKKSHPLLFSSPSRWNNVTFIKDAKDVTKKINTNEVRSILVVGSFYLPFFIKSSMEEKSTTHPPPKG